MARTSGLWWRAVVALVPLAVVAVFYPARAPSPSAAAGGFSIDRAWEHLRAITAHGPHPVESAANEKVRGYLVEQLGRFGWEVHVEEGRVFGRTVHNVLAKLAGRQPEAGAAVLLCAHYDSVRAGPGAGDDGAAVAAMLEAARCLAEGARPRQEVLLLITDGEEGGLRGARAFCGDDVPTYKQDVAVRQPASTLAAHPALASVGLVLNFDARGSAGPSVMYETGPGNGRLIGHFATAAPHPLANSLSYDVYRMLRNDSDFTIFRRAGKQGLNFAFIGDYFNYHTPNDTPDRLDGRSMYHQGANMLPVARHFANLDAAELARVTAAGQPNAVYFNATASTIVRYPAAWIWPLTAVQLVLAGVVLMRAFSRGVISGVGLVGALVRFVLAIIVAPAAVYGLIRMLRPPQSSVAFDLQLTAIVGVAVVITLALALEFRRRTSLADLVAVGLLVISLLSIPANVWLPGGSFLTIWPGLFLCAGLGATSRWPADDWRRTVACTLASLPVVFVMTPLAVMLFTALTLAMSAFLAPVVVLTAWLLIAALAPAMARPVLAPAAVIN